MMRLAFALLLAPLLAGCGSAGYYWQGIRGEMEILERAEPIPVVVQTTQDTALKAKLERAMA
ncbi:MAG: aminopeptidase, partial [Betaproteobacteria bacterium]